MPRTASSDAYIILLTAHGGGGQDRRSLDGRDDYLTMPFSLGELVARIRAMLRRPRIKR
jgi:DNA-binding response OmpR family regulator